MVLRKIYCSQIDVLEWRRECDFDLGDKLDVWRIYIPDYVSKIEGNKWLIKENELVKSGSFLHEDDRNRYLLGKIYLRKLLSKYLKINPFEVDFEFLEFKKPILSSYPNFKFNISHSGNYIIFGFANRWSVGVDVEWIEPKVDLYNLIFSTMSSVEVSAILNSESVRDMFYKHWTRKESYLKSMGIGLTDRMNEISVCDGLNFVPSDLSSFSSSYNIRNFTIGNEYSASVAFDAGIRVVRFYHLCED